MGLYARDVASLAGNEESERKLGEVLSAKFSDLDVDSVEEVKTLRR